jgi:hypothetical protein
MSVYCDKIGCNTMVFVGEETDPEAFVKQISHNEWHHASKEDTIVRARELLDDVEYLLSDVESGNFLGGYVKADMLRSQVMKISKFCEDNM